MTVNKSESKKKNKKKKQKKKHVLHNHVFRNSCGSLKLQYLRRLFDLIGGYACV